MSVAKLHKLRGFRHAWFEGSAICLDEQRVYSRNLEVPSGGAVGTARAIAHAYSVFATGGRELGLRTETLDPPGRSAARVRSVHPEPEGSLGFADPVAGIGYGYVTSQMGTSLTGDPRDVALRNALYSAIISSEAGGRLVA